MSNIKKMPKKKVKELGSPGLCENDRIGVSEEAGGWKKSSQLI